MIDNKYLLKSEIYKVISNHHWCDPEQLKRLADHCLLELYLTNPQVEPPEKIKFITEGRHIEMIGCAPNGLKLSLDKEMAKAYGILWDGTHEGVEKIKKDLEGKIFILNQGIEL